MKIKPSKKLKNKKGSASKTDNNVKVKLTDHKSSFQNRLKKAMRW